jgi:hypothetical protein
VISGSRAAAFGLLVGIVVLARMRGLIDQRHLRIAIRSLLLIVAALFLTSLFFPQFTSGLFRFETGSRTILWARAVFLAADHPVLGVGFAASDQVFSQDSLYLRSIGIFISGAHSSPLRLLVDMGIVGVLVVTLSFVSTLHYAIGRLRAFHDPRLGSTLVALIAASLTNSIFESWLFGFGSSSTVPFWLCLATLSYQADAVKLKRTSRHSEVAPATDASSPDTPGYPSAVAPVKG